MYVPPHFSEDRVAVLHQAIREARLGTLVTSFAGGIEASHLPMLIDPEPLPFGTLRGHLARANPQWQRAARDGEALVLFLGPDAYITPSWYETKRQSGKVVPTWNYVAVHAYGRAEFYQDAGRLRELVTRLTRVHEAPRAEPWAVDDAPGDYLAGMLQAIVGFDLPIARLEGKWKMSQNRSPADRAGVVQGLAREGGPKEAAVAEIMAAKEKG